jgi:uroporphyrinogen-III synthase
LKRLFIIRPEPGCTATAAAARALGLDVTAAPLFTIQPCAWTPPPGCFDAIIAGSANAFRHGGAGLDGLRGLPVLAVGPSTAEAARAAGFAVASTGKGGLQELLDRHSGDFRELLRLSGRDRVGLNPLPGLRVTECIVYASEAAPMPGQVAEALRKGGVAALHSAIAARHFAAECNRLGISRGGITLAVIGPRVADACGTGWAAIACAETPDDTALLALAQVLCQE